MWFLFNGWDHTMLSHSICDAEITLAQQAHLSKHTCVRTHTHITIYRHMLIGTHSHRHTHTYTHIHSYTHTHAHTHPPSRTCTHTHTSTDTPSRPWDVSPTCMFFQQAQGASAQPPEGSGSCSNGPTGSWHCPRVTASPFSHTEGGHDLSRLYINVWKTARGNSPHLCITATALGRWNLF